MNTSTVERKESPRKINNRIKREHAEIESQRNQKPVKELTITIEWKKSRMWGNNPNASVAVSFHDGTFERRDGYKCSGCGYDKESTVIAQIFNDFLKYKLYQPRKLESRINQETVNHPYGVYYYDGGTLEDKRDSEGYIRKPCFNGGVGTSCYYNIGKFIGGTFEHVASGKSFDVFKYTDNSEVK